MEIKEKGPDQLWVLENRWLLKTGLLAAAGAGLLLAIFSIRWYGLHTLYQPSLERLTTPIGLLVAILAASFYAFKVPNRWVVFDRKKQDIAWREKKLFQAAQTLSRKSWSETGEIRLDKKVRRSGQEVFRLEWQGQESSTPLFASYLPDEHRQHQDLRKIQKWLEQA
ncbi:MAG: hypothetical protein AAFR61_22925 [Bacteroidota bacterium]